MLDRSISSTITVGGATNAGTFEAAELMVASMSAREVAWLRLVVDEAALSAQRARAHLLGHRRHDGPLQR